MSNDINNIFINVKSAKSFRSIEELISEAYNESPITICQYNIGSHIKRWRKAKKGDNVIYAIDNLGTTGGEITYLLKRCFRPRFINDNDDFKSIIHFIQGIDPKKFGKHWGDYMIEEHWKAIEQKRWLFFVFCVFTPSYRLEGNRDILLEKARQMNEAEDELDKEAARLIFGDSSLL